MLVKKQTTLCALPNPVPGPLWAGGSFVGQLQDCTHSCGSLWAVWVVLLPHWHLLASAVLHHALGTATCPPYCKPSSANTVLKPDQELVN